MLMIVEAMVMVMVISRVMTTSVMIENISIYERRKQVGNVGGNVQVHEKTSRSIDKEDKIQDR